MKPSKLDTKKVYVAGALAAGVSQAELAQQLDVNQSTVSRFSSREDIREAIEKEALSILECLPDAVENIKSLVKSMKSLSPTETKRFELALKASFRVLESSGIINSPTASQTIISLTKMENSLVSPLIDQLLRNISCTVSAEIVDNDD